MIDKKNIEAMIRLFEKTTTSVEREGVLLSDDKEYRKLEWQLFNAISRLMVAVENNLKRKSEEVH